MEKNKFLKLNPMLLHEIFEPFDSKDYIFEIKFDGVRALIFINNENIIIKSRNGIILNDTYPELLEIKNISKGTCIFDGEIVLLENGVPSFSKLQERTRLKNKFRIEEMKEKNPVTFVCFDILYKDKDLTNLPLIKRKKILDKINDNNIFVKSKCFEEYGIKLFQKIKKENLEGIIAKKRDSLYTYGIRTKEWIKIKNFKEETFLICGYIKNKNNTLSIILGENDNNHINFVGKVLMGPKNDLYSKILNDKEVKNYLEDYNDDETIFIKPKYNLIINYMERTKNNMLRQPFIKYDEDK